MAKDMVDELVERSTKKNPAFPRLLAEAEARRSLTKAFAAARVQRGLTQAAVAARMRVSPSMVSRIESAGNVNLSTVLRYCVALGASLAVTFPTAPRRSRRAATRDGQSDGGL